MTRGPTMNPMKRDLPDHAPPPPRDEFDAPDEPPRSLLASRAFWLGGLVSVAIWATVISLLYVVAR